MERLRGIIFAIIAMTAVYFIIHATREKFDEIEYRGQKFKLSKQYSDWEDYKDDPDNLAPGQEAAIEKAMSQAKLEPSFPNLNALIDGNRGIDFPGYGSAYFGVNPEPDGTTLAGQSVEIPLSGKERVFVYRLEGGVFKLFDDFVIDSSKGIMGVRTHGADLEYLNLSKTVVLRRQPHVD